MIHSITSSAATSNVCGIARPSAFVVLRLTTSSNFTVCWTGKSPGFSPLTIDLAGRNTPPAETNSDAERPTAWDGSHGTSNRVSDARLLDETGLESIRLAIDEARHAIDGRSRELETSVPPAVSAIRPLAPPRSTPPNIKAP